MNCRDLENCGCAEARAWRQDKATQEEDHIRRADLDAAQRAANPPIVLGELPHFYQSAQHGTFAKPQVEIALGIMKLLWTDGEPPEVFWDPTRGDGGWMLRKATEDPFVYMGDGTWLSRSTIKNMIRDTGYLDIKAEESLGVGQPEVWMDESAPLPVLRSPVDQTLTERGGRYGDFTDNAYYAQNIKEDMRESPNWDTMEDFKKEALDFIASKIGRLLSGDSDYADNWHDIQGFAKLVEDRLPKQETK